MDTALSLCGVPAKQSCALTVSFLSFFFFLRNYYCRAIGFLSFLTVAIMFYLYVCTLERELVSEEGLRKVFEMEMS